MIEVEVVVSGKTVTVKAPFSPDFPAPARDAGGNWNGDVWTFDVRDESRVRALCREIYGTDGAVAETVTVRTSNIPWDKTMFAYGRRVAHRPSRDERVRLGEGVVIIEGGFPPSGGSVKNPRLDPEQGTVLEIRDVPAGHADVVPEDIVDRSVDVEALRAEREHLLARLAEINALLSAENAD